MVLLFIFILIYLQPLFSQDQKADALPTAAAAKWTSLLDENLSQWQMYLSYQHKPGYNGEMPKDDKGQIIPPVGYNNNVNDVFTVISEEGQPVLRISGEIYGCLFTKQAFENYHLILQVKWGEKKWPPRMQLLRDSGILYHYIGENGVDYWRSWKLAQEFQVMQGHMGDFWGIASSAIDIRAFLPEGKMNAVASIKQPFLAFGSGSDMGGFCLRSADYESPPGEWTTLEWITFEDKSIHIVNGNIVMVLRNSRYMKDGAAVPLTKGQIQLQSEAAEVFYKAIRIGSLEALPVQYTSFFK
jgi:3-keto-disaccharide hydrolase